MSSADLCFAKRSAMCGQRMSRRAGWSICVAACPHVYFVEAEPFCRDLMMSLVLPGGLAKHWWVKRRYALAKLPFSPKRNGCHSPPLQEWSQALGLLDAG